MRNLFLAAILALVPQVISLDSIFAPVGVCSLADDEPACWDVEGRSAPELLQRVRDEIARFRMDISFVSGKKNRFIVIRASRSESPVFESEYGRLNGVIEINASKGRLIIVRLAAPMAAETVGLTAKIGLPVEPGHVVRFRSGVKADIDGDRVEIGAIKPIPENPNIRRFPEGYAAERRGRQWQVLLGQSDKSPYRLDLRFIPLDARGSTIAYVDPQGRPVPEAVGRAFYSKDASGGEGFPRVRPAFFRRNLNGYGPLEVVHCESNIDPKSLFAVRMTRVVEREERIGVLPLDPK